MVGWFRRFRPPPLRWSFSVSVGLRFSFPLPFQGLPAPGHVCWCALSLFFCVPLLMFRVSNLSCHFHFHLIFVPLFILTSTSLQANNPAFGRVCVCVKRLNRRKTSRPAHIYILYFYDSRGSPGSPGGR